MPRLSASPSMIATVSVIDSFGKLGTSGTEGLRAHSMFAKSACVAATSILLRSLLTSMYCRLSPSSWFSSDCSSCRSASLRANSFSVRVNCSLMSFSIFSFVSTSAWYWAASDANIAFFFSSRTSSSFCRIASIFACVCASWGAGAPKGLVSMSSASSSIAWRYRL